MIIVLDISPSDRTIYSTETTIEVYPSLHYLQPLAGRSFTCTELEYHFIQNINHAFTLKSCHFLLHNFLLDDLTYQYLKSYWRHLRLYLSYFIDLQSLLFFFCFQPCNPLNKCPWQKADTKQLLYKLSPATNASLELSIGAA